MSISGIAPSANGHPNGIQVWFPQLRKAIEALTKSLASGDLAGAKKAYAALMQDRQNVAQAQHGPQTAANSQLSADLGAIGDALQLDSLAGAQKAFATLTQNMQKTRQAQGGQQTQNTQRHHTSSAEVTASGSALKSAEFAKARKAFTLLMQNRHKTIATLGSGNSTSSQSVGTTIDVAT